jgi:hypothetical protein
LTSSLARDRQPNRVEGLIHDQQEKLMASFDTCD